MESFLKYLKYEKRCSQHTITAYETDLKQFQAFSATAFKQESIENADYNCIRSWIVRLIESGTEPRSVNRKIASLKAYYKYLLKQKYINKNPTDKIIAPKTKKSLPHFVETEAMDQLLDHSLFEETFEGQRDKAIMEFIYGTGVRLSELIALKEKDANPDTGQIRVTGKGNKERYIPVHQSLNQVIKQYLQFKSDEGLQGPDTYLFLTKKGKPTYPMLIYRIVKKYLNMVTTIEQKSPHVLRHSFATQLLNKGADLNAIKELLGHANLAATQVYTHNSIEKLKNIYKQAHPRG